MKRHDRVWINFTSRPWPECAVYPADRTGTVQEIINDMAIIAVDHSAASAFVKVQYLEVIPHETRN